MHFIFVGILIGLGKGGCLYLPCTVVFCTDCTYLSSIYRIGSDRHPKCESVDGCGCKHEFDDTHTAILVLINSSFNSTVVWSFLLLLTR